jgi:RimJ/RimL family protein N-acetyltransferase
MALAPTLVSARLRLVPLGETHMTQRYVGWLNDREVVRFSEQRFVRHTLDSCAAYARSFQGTPHYLWAIEATSPSLGHIGNLNAYVDERNRTADLGILIGEKGAWGQGYGREAWRLAIGFLLRSGRIRKVTAGTLATNLGMLAIMRAVGMVEDGRRARHVLVDGHEVDVIHAALFREDYLMDDSR